MTQINLALQFIYLFLENKIYENQTTLNQNRFGSEFEKFKKRNYTFNFNLDLPNFYFDRNRKYS